MQFEEFVDTVRRVIERDFSNGEPVDVALQPEEADFTLAQGLGRLTLVHGLVQVALDKADGSIVTPNKSEPITPDLATASSVARFFARGADENV